MAKKTKKIHPKKHIQHTDTHIVLRRSLLVYSVLIFLLFSMASMSIYLIDRMIVYREQNERYHTIVSVLDSLNLNQGYNYISSDIFGDKRQSVYDNQKTQASVGIYTHNDTPENTRNDIRIYAEKAGFSYVATENEDSVSPVIVMKSNDSTYLRIRVYSKAIKDDIMYRNDDNFRASDHANEAPSYIEIRVNLDGNND